MPMTISSPPRSPNSSMSQSISGMRLSPPSREKRFAPMYFLCRKVSSVSASVRRARMRSFSSRLSWISFPVDSIRSCSQRRMTGSSPCMNSTPMVRV